MNLGLPGRTFYVTGAASGIGAASVNLLLAGGAKVAACDRDRAGLDKLKAMGGQSLLTLVADIAVKAQIDDSLQACRDKFPGLGPGLAPQCMLATSGELRESPAGLLPP